MDVDKPLPTINGPDLAPLSHSAAGEGDSTDATMIKRKPLVVAGEQDQPKGFKAKFNTMMPPHRRYLGQSRRTILISVGVLIALLGIIIGLAVGLIRKGA